MQPQGDGAAEIDRDQYLAEADVRELLEAALRRTGELRRSFGGER